MNFFVTGIGTDVGKTVAAALLCEALQADYWKPIQAGSLDHSDSDEVRRLLPGRKMVIHSEAYRLTHPMSPHAAARRDAVEIDPKKIILPQTSAPLIIEGAGGLLVPLTNDFFVVDLIEQLHASVVLVSKHYVGSINHTLLSAEALKRRNIPVVGILFLGEQNPETEQVIVETSGLKKIAVLPWVTEVTPEYIAHFAPKLRQVLQFVLRMRLDP